MRDFFLGLIVAYGLGAIGTFLWLFISYLRGEELTVSINDQEIDSPIMNLFAILALTILAWPPLLFVAIKEKFGGQ